MRPTSGKNILDYYVLVSVDSIASTLFLYCGFFWAKQYFGYSDTQNLLMGGAQGLAAVLAPRFGGKLGDRIGYDRLIFFILPALALLLAVGSFFRIAATPVIFTTLYIGLLSSTWPSIEAQVMHAPSRFSMPTRLGFYNMTWSLSGAFGFLVSGFVFSWNPAGILWIPALLHLGVYTWLRLRPDATADTSANAMSRAHHGQNVSRETKRSFLHTAWLANAVNYFMSTAFLALAPQLGQRFNLDASHTIWLSCSLLFARGAAFIVFWRWKGWHYRKVWSQAALWLAPVCLAFIFFSAWIPFVATAFVLFGLASGLTYYTSIYYSLDYGENKGEHGGLHEAILGLGILLGPLVGALGSKLFGGTIGGQITIVAASVLLSACSLLFRKQLR